MQSSNDLKCEGENLALASHAVRLSPGEPGFFDKLAEILASFSDCEEVKILCEIDNELQVVGSGKPLAATLTSRRFKDNLPRPDAEAGTDVDAESGIESVKWNLLDSSGAFLGQLLFVSVFNMSQFRDKRNLYEFWQNLLSRELEVFRKTAEQKKLEADREELEGQLIRAQKVDAMNLFASGVAHDLNNLLTPLFGYISLLKTQKSISGEGSRYLSEIELISRRAKELTQEILLKAKNQDGPTQAFSVQELMREVEAQLKVILSEDITMIFEYPKEEIVLDGRSVELHQILTNLTQNALLAMSERGGVLTVQASLLSSEKSIQSQPKSSVLSSLQDLSQMRVGQSLRLVVRDTGVGIDKTIGEKIFSPFFSTRPDRGSGLGLSVVQSLVQKNGGTLSWSSSPGQGTVFEVLLPIVAATTLNEISEVEPPADLNARRAAAEGLVSSEFTLFQNPGAMEAQSQKPRVMVVDDEASIGKMCVEFLQLYDIDVVFFDDGEAALAHFSLNPQAYDLLLTDFSMPKLTGEQLIQKFYEIRREMPFILMSGDQFHFDQGFEFGVTQVFKMVKPFDFNELPKIIRDLIGKSQQRAAVTSPVE